MTERIVEVSADLIEVDPQWLREVETLVDWVLESEKVDNAILSIALLPDSGIEQLNTQYLSHEGPTDVISFPLDGPPGRIVGDIYIGYEQALRQAGEFESGPKEEILRLAVHGTLHVLGWDHPETEHRLESPMYKRQEELLLTWESAKGS